MSIFISLLLLSFPTTFASEEVTRKEVFQYFSENFSDDIPQTYLYIDVKYRGLERYPQLKKALQVLIYTDKIKNRNTRFYPEARLSQYDFLILSEKILDIDYGKDIDERLKNIPLTESDFRALKKYIKQEQEKLSEKKEKPTVIISSSN